jgi:hypothetical protein
MSPRFFLLSSIFLCFNNFIVPADGGSAIQEELKAPLIEEREASEALLMLINTAVSADGGSAIQEELKVPKTATPDYSGQYSRLKGLFKYSELYKYFAQHINDVARYKRNPGARGGSVPTTLKIIKENPDDPILAVLNYSMEHGNQIKITSAFMQAKRHGKIINNLLDPKIRVDMEQFARTHDKDKVIGLFRRHSPREKSTTKISPKKTATKRSTTRA